MSAPDTRIGRFVKAARTLLLAQLLAALLATVIALWAFIEVRSLVEERDRLQARVAELEAAAANRPAPLDAPVVVPPMPEYDYNSAIDANLLPPAAEPLPIEPGNVGPPAAPIEEPEAQDPVRDPRTDCTGANARLPRCRALEPRTTIPMDRLTPRGPALGEEPRGNEAQPAPQP